MPPVPSMSNVIARLVLVATATKVGVPRNHHATKVGNQSGCPRLPFLFFHVWCPFSRVTKVRITKVRITKVRITKVGVLFPSFFQCPFSSVLKWVSFFHFFFHLSGCPFSISSFSIFPFFHFQVSFFHFHREDLSDGRHRIQSGCPFSAFLFLLFLLFFSAFSTSFSTFGVLFLLFYDKQE
jgi:hypothetical protein